MVAPDCRVLGCSGSMQLRYNVIGACPLYASVFWLTACCQRICVCFLFLPLSMGASNVSVKEFRLVHEKEGRKLREERHESYGSRKGIEMEKT